jgi:hypothetical protein
MSPACTCIYSRGRDITITTSATTITRAMTAWGTIPGTHREAGAATTRCSNISGRDTAATVALGKTTFVIAIATSVKTKTLARLTRMPKCSDAWNDAVIAIETVTTTFLQSRSAMQPAIKGSVMCG